jgi:hypothetical protein
VLNSIEDAVADGMADHDQSGALERAEWQIRRFLDELHRHGALRGQSPAQAYFVEARPAAANVVPGIRFGIAFSEPGRFVEFSIDLAGERAGRTHKARGLEAEQILS